MNSKDGRDEIFDMVLQYSLLGNETNTPGAELQLINEVKQGLLDALGAFGPDLPAQFSSQIESRVLTMSENNEMLRSREELNGFIILYKIELDSLAGMVDTGKQEEGESRKKTDQVDDMANVRGKIRGYEGKFQKMYDKVRQSGIDYISLSKFKGLIGAFAKSNGTPVEWLEAPKGEEE